MSKKVRPNEPCPCGSGKKFKKCCDAPGTRAASGLPHTQADRAAVFQKLDAFIDEVWQEEEEEAFDSFWGRHLEREGELSAEMLVASREVQETWFAFDYELDLEGELRVVDDFLEEAELSSGERSFVMAVRQSSMRLYEVTDTVPGSSMTLRDLIEGTTVKVSERSASRTISRHECLAARVIPRGRSGQPEMECGVLHLPKYLRDGLVAHVKQRRTEFLREHPSASTDAFYKLLPPLFHDVWITSIFEPGVPRMANTDGEEMTVTRVSFHVDDELALSQALGAALGESIVLIEPGAWGWNGKSKSEAEVALGRFELRDAILTAEVNSVERGVRARELLERLAGAALRHRGTTHEDMRRQVMETVTARLLGRDDETSSPSKPELDPHLADAVIAEHYARHYRAWVDEGVPALEGLTPREAAKNLSLRSRVEELLHGLEGMYERALKNGQPAYDPSWMWADLGLATEADASSPPPLAHERVAERVPGSGDASRACAERARALPSFSDTSTTLGEDELRHDLELQRFLRRDRPSDNDAGQEGIYATPYITLMVNFDLHRRKAFWVDAALSFMLENTDLDVAGRELRTPFTSFAVVFTDRHALSLGERFLSRKAEDPLRGQLLRVLTVYVTEEHRADARVLAITFAFDALGADLPSLVSYEVPADDEASLRAFLESVAPRAIVEPPVRDTSPVRALLRLVLNAILYATSAGVTPEVRTIAPRKRSPRSPQPTPHSDSVFFLPGKIDIRQVRQLQELQRAPDGGTLFARFMVRGHWRRPAKSWTEQGLRWIEPYWKGPDMASVIEKAYRLKA